MTELGKIFVRIAVNKNREAKKCWGIEEGSVSGDCRIVRKILWTIKDRWRATDEEHDEDYVKDGFQLARVKLDMNGKGGREASGMGYCSGNTWNGLELKLPLSRKSSSYFENNFPVFLLSGNLNTSFIKVYHVLHWVYFLVNQDLLQYFP